MQNSEYWKQRFTQLEAAQNRMGAETFADIERQYQRAQREIEGQIARWHQRFADNNGITLAEARKMLDKGELKELKWDVQEYIKSGQENAVSGKWMTELENASARFHISRLEALKIQTQQSMETLFARQNGALTAAMGKMYKSSYYRTAYEVQKGFNIGWDIAGVDQRTLEKVISKPWAADGKNFSERIWGNKDRLIQEVHNELTQNILLGADPQKAIDKIAKKMNTSKHNAGRLVMTEEAYFSSAAQRDCFNDLDVEQYEIVATLDSHTSDICRSLDGKVFPMKDYEAGVTAPPFHVYCRSTTVPYFDDDFGQPEERAARDEETGKTYYVPADMSYQDWKEAFVDGGAKSGLAEVNEKSVAKGSDSGIIKSESRKAVAKSKKILTLQDRSRIINEAINAKEPVFAEDLRKAYKNVSTKEGCQDIVLHGTPYYTEYEKKYILDTETLSYIISGRRDYKAENIRLLSCSTGKADKYGNCVAQKLANLLGVDVYAPTDLLNIHPDGKLTVGRQRLSEEEGFRWFHPKKKSVGD